MREQVTFFCPAHPAESPDCPRSAVVPCVHVTSVVSGRACLGCRSTPRAIGHVRGLLLVLCFRELGLMCVGLGSTSHMPSVQQLTAIARPVQTSIATPTSTSHLQTSTNPPQHATTHTHGLSRSALAVCTARGTHFITYRQEMMHKHERWCCGGVWGLHIRVSCK